MSTLTLRRFHSTEEVTLGCLWVSDKQGIRFHGFTVERPWLDNKSSVSCIPTGAYPLVWRTYGSYATKFQRMEYPGSLEIDHVPDRSAILFHTANYPKDVEGCVGVGYTCDPQKLMVGHSRVCVLELYNIIAKSGPSYKWNVLVEDWSRR